MAYNIDSLQRSTLIDSVASLESLKTEYEYDALDQLMNSGHIDEVREMLERYRRIIKTFREK